MYEKKRKFPKSVIFSNGPTFYNTDGPANLVKFYKNTSSDNIWEIWENICTHFIYVVGNGLV